MWPCADHDAETAAPTWLRHLDATSDLMPCTCKRCERTIPALAGKHIAQCARSQCLQSLRVKDPCVTLLNQCCRHLLAESRRSIANMPPYCGQRTADATCGLVEQIRRIQSRQDAVLIVELLEHSVDEGCERLSTGALFWRFGRCSSNMHAPIAQSRVSKLRERASRQQRATLIRET